MNENDNSVLTVTEITNLVKSMIDESFPLVTVEGEISNFRPNAGGHLYFTLKDDGAQLAAVMFKGRASSLSFQPKDGMKVKATGNLTVYAAQGKYQINISKMEIAGEGDILKMIEDRKRKLAEEGLFDQSRKKPLPFYPKTVGVITSSSGAAVRDILNIAKRRNNGISVVILPALVQGETAAPTIVKQIRTANKFKMCDVLIVGRGGGSLEDLLPFSDENVVREIANSSIPIVSAVGHEIDWSLADYAADIRAPTPSAAAELVFPEKEEIIERIEGLKEDLKDKMESLIKETRMELKSFDTSSMEIRLRSITQPLKTRIDSAIRDISEGIRNRTDESFRTIEKCKRTLEDSNPTKILERGFSVIRTSDGKIIKSQNDINVGDKINITVTDGTFNATVNNK